ncbi:MAG: hypothetical protein AB1342_12450 [Pseudomonadota bacterium]
MIAALSNSFSQTFLRRRVDSASARWIAGAVVAAVIAWIVGLATLLAVASRVHDDVPRLLAIKLPLLKSDPDLIFAGESRTAYGVDAGLAAQLRGEKPGSAVNIAYDAGEPLAVLGAAKIYPDVFAKAHVVVSVAPFIFNEGVRSAGVYPQDVLSRLSVTEQLTSFLPLRVGTLIRYIREAFAARLAQQQDVAHDATPPVNSGLSVINSTQRDDQWIARLADHPHFANWDVTGPKAKFETGALCDLAKRSRRLTVVIPPWAVRYDRAADPVWRAREEQVAGLLNGEADRCGFSVLDVQSVPELKAPNFADEMHVNVSGVPIYTRYLVEQLKR